MSFFYNQNPGIGGLDELTLAEEIVVQNLGSLGDPNADRILFWDDSAGAFAYLTAGTGLTITGTTITASAGTIDGSGTLNEIAYWVDSDTLGALAVATYPSLTELSYVKGATSAIQTQINTKAPTASPTFTGTVTVPATNFTVGASLPFSDVAGVLTLQNVDALDATTEATIEAAIDTLANLTSVQGQTLTLAGAFITSGANSLTLTTTGATNVTLPTTGTLATLAGTETLSGKTLTAPKFADLGYIADANGNEILILDTVASAVNELTLANAATGNPPMLSATGSDTDIGITLVPKGAGIVKGELKRFMVRLLDNTTDQTTGTTKGGDYRISNRAITVKAVGAYVDTAGTTNTCTVDINEAGTTILSTKITIDSTEKSSETAATPPVISDSAIAADAIITFDIDAIQTTPAKGLVVWIDYVYA